VTAGQATAIWWALQLIGYVTCFYGGWWFRKELDDWLQQRRLRKATARAARDISSITLAARLRMHDILSDERHRQSF
jgi:hypothetical protein